MKSLGILALSCALVPLVSSPTWPADDGFVLRSQVPPGNGLAALRTAVMGARRRLEQPECQRLFTEFTDASGRPLQENLDALGQTGAGFLGLILFADASARPHCKAGGSFAFTTPGSRVIYVCGAQLKDAADQNAAKAEAVVIHEALHSLGLGENPPTSSEITARVLERCHS
jgi:hypothetical protein